MMSREVRNIATLKKRASTDTASNDFRLHDFQGRPESKTMHISKDGIAKTEGGGGCQDRCTRRRGQAKGGEVDGQTHPRF
jgi:hypothetical protein